MPIPHLASPDLPATMTWEEYGALPEETARYIELHDGRPVWIADEVLGTRGPSEHQRYMRRFTNSLEITARHARRESLGPCWDVGSENNIYFAADRSLLCHP